MSTHRPVQPILIVLPVAAFALTLLALAAHAETGDIAWYRGALFADLGGLVVAVFATLAGVIDAVSLPRFTVARSCGLRQAGFSALGLIFFAATATAIFNRYEGRALGDIFPLALAIVGLAVISIAAWYGRVVEQDFQRHETTVWYPAHMLARTPARRVPGSSRTLV